MAIQSMLVSMAEPWSHVQISQLQKLHRLTEVCITVCITFASTSAMSAMQCTDASELLATIWYCIQKFVAMCLLLQKQVWVGEVCGDRVEGKIWVEGGRVP